MAESYDFRIVKSGKEIETYYYKDKEILRGYKKRTKKKERKRVFRTVEFRRIRKRTKTKKRMGR